MNRIIQFTETRPNGDVQVYVSQYLESEMEECFSAEERLWLSEGKIAERKHEFILSLIHI